ncbi:MAG: hypothetical protein R2817_08075 [Flavobacteriales bacterium]
MQRLIRSFNTLTDALKETLQEQYPDGIDSTHIRSIPTAKGEILRVIELRTPDALYLIKINPESRAEIDEFLDQEENAPAGDDMEGGDDLGGGDEAETEDDSGADDDDADEDDGDSDEGDDDGGDDDED